MPVSEYKGVQWYAYSPETAGKRLDTDLTRGLAPMTVKKRQSIYGKNVFQKESGFGILQSVINQFKSPLVFILLIAGIITLLLREYIDTIVIAITLLINVVIGTFQEERAGRAFEKLRGSQEKWAFVLREGHKLQVRAEELVPGDVVFIEGGSYVPADLRLIEAKSLSINEAVLTGEWVDVGKETDEIRKKHVPLSGQINMAWMGTLVASGYGKGVVVETGERTEVGKIAKELREIENKATPLQENIKRIARFLVWLIGIAVVVIFVLGLFRGESIGEMLFVSIAIAVASMPTGLPAAVTVVLALGMEAILRRGGLVRNLLAAETLGATTVILTDKTGTLTEAKMQLASLMTLDGVEEIGEIKKNDMLLEVAVKASGAFVEESSEKETGLIVRGRPIERAIVLAGIERGFSHEGLMSGNGRVDFLQFESSRRFGASLNAREGTKRNRVYINGAPETLLETAGYVDQGGVKKKMTKRDREHLRELFERHSGEGMRIIASAYKDVPWDSLPEAHEGGDEQSIVTGSVFAGLVGFHDPIRSGVANSIGTVKQAGARVIMLTGDNPETAGYVARAVGITKSAEDRVILGTELEKMDDEELRTALLETNVFSRVLPSQKLRVARLLQSGGEVVAMTGDGVNDAPALRSANIGVAVGSGTEVAKEASDLVLINNSFSIIVWAIEEGRRIIDNLKKIISYLLSTSMSEVILIGGALVAGAPLPLLPAQILWANIVEEGFMSFSFAFEKKEDDIMRRNPRSNSAKNVLTREIKELIFLVSAITGALLLALYYVLLQFDLPIEEVRTVMFAALSLDSIFFTLSFKSLRKPLWKINPFSNIFLIVALVVSIVLLIGALSLSPLQTLLSLVPLNMYEIGLLVAIGIFNLFLIETLKYFFFERKEKIAQAKTA